MRTTHHTSVGGERKQPSRLERRGGASAAIRRGGVLVALFLCGCAGQGVSLGNTTPTQLDLEQLAAVYGVSHVEAVATAPEGSHYVLDAQEARIYRFAPDGTVLVLPLECKQGDWRPDKLVVDAVGYLTVGGRSAEFRSVYDTGGYLVHPCGVEVSKSLAGSARPAGPLEVL